MEDVFLFGGEWSGAEGGFLEKRKIDGSEEGTRKLLGHMVFISVQ
jgi:hypothetical protein